MVSHLESEWFYTLLKVWDQTLFQREMVKKAEESVCIFAYLISLLRQR